MAVVEVVAVAAVALVVMAVECKIYIAISVAVAPERSS
jgi:hypothetical protein